MKGYYKVPFRRCYADSIRGWVKACWHCYVVLRVFPPNLPSLGN